MSDNPLIDEYGFYGPLPTTSRQRTIPKEGFPPGLGVGERVPDFKLLNQRGDLVDFHADRDGASTLPGL